MIGNTLSEFLDDILTMGGPEKEFLFHRKKNICYSVRNVKQIHLLRN